MPSVDLSQSTEPPPFHYQVIISGGGPVGLFTGIVLASHGIRVCVLEVLPQISDSPRAAAHLPVVIGEMMEANVYEAVKLAGSESTGFSYWRGTEPQKECLASIGGAQGHLIGLNCAQPTFARVLLERLKTYTNATISFDCELIDINPNTPENGPVRVTCRSSTKDHIEMTCDWLIGADGSRSTVRKLLGIPFEGFTWPKEEFVATNVIYPFEHFGFRSGNFLIHPVNWAVVAALEPKEHLWRVAYGTRPGMTIEELTAELPERFKDFLPDPSIDFKLVQISPYRVHQRCASQFRKGRVILVGDAAHSNNPIGGLGLTGGLLDAGPLARALAAVVENRAPDSLLDKWATLRRNIFMEYTNLYSIENKRVIQQGGYGDDPVEKWVHDEIAERYGMIKWLANATLGAKERDEAMIQAIREGKASPRSMTWNMALPVDWMADYETEEVVERRRRNRPIFDWVPI